MSYGNKQMQITNYKFVYNTAIGWVSKCSNMIGWVSQCRHMIINNIFEKYKKVMH